MALNTLTLAVVQGVQGRRFRSKINGLTAGTIVSFDTDATPGFGESNGRLSHHALPYTTNTVAIRERVPATGETKVTRIEIAAASASEIAALAAAQITAPRTLRGQRTAATDDGAGSLTWALSVENDLGATVVVPIGSDPNVYNVSATSLAKYHAGLARVAGGGHMLIGMVGESHVTGSGAGTTASYLVGAQPLSFPSRMAAAFTTTTPTDVASTWGNHERLSTLLTYDTRMGLGAGWLGSSGSLPGVGGHMFRNTADTTSMDFTPGVPTDTFTHLFAWNTGAGRGITTVQVDAGAVSANIDQGNAPVAGIGAYKATAALGAHAYKIARVSGNVNIIGAIAYNSAVPGIHVCNMGRNGGVVAEMADNTSSAAWGPLPILTALASGALVATDPALKMDLMVLELGTNDWFALTDLTAFSANVLKMIDGVVANASVAIVSAPPSDPTMGGNPSYAVQATYVAALKAAALSRDCVFIDEWSRLGGVYSAANMSDDLHMNAATHDSLGAFLAAQVLAK